MTAPASRWKLGLFVVAGTAIGLGGVAFLGARELQRATHTAYAYFDEALTGLEEGSPVKFRGVTVGVVDRIRFAVDKKHLEVQAALYDDYLSDLGLDANRLEGDDVLTEELRAQVVMSWVTSTAFIQVDYFPDPPRGPQLLPFDTPTDGPVLRTVPSTAKSLESSTREVLTELPRVAGAARELVELLRTELRAARLPELSRKLQALLDKGERQLDAFEQQGTIAAATGAMKEVGATAAALREERGALRATLDEWAEVGRALRAEVAAMQLDEASGDVREAARSLTGLRADVAGQLARLDRALAAVERLAATLERDPGSVLHGRGATPSPLRSHK